MMVCSDNRFDSEWNSNCYFDFSNEIYGYDIGGFVVDLNFDDV